MVCADPALWRMNSFLAHCSRSRLAGIDLITCPTGVKDVVTLTGALPAGDAFAPQDNPLIPALTAALLDQGTKLRDKFEVSRQLEAVGASVSFSCGNSMLNLYARCLRKDLPLVAALIAEQLRAPAFAPEELDKVRKKFASGLKQRTENAEYRAAEGFQRLIYPAEHPNYPHSTAELLAALDRANRSDVEAFHARFFGGNHLVLVAVGDIDASAWPGEVGRLLADWKGGEPVKRGLRVQSPRLARSESVPMPDKTSVNLILGQTSGLIYGDPDYVALQVGTAILGQGFTSRLMSQVRVKEGLTYGVGASLAGDQFNEGEWRIASAFTPGLLENGIASIRRQLEFWYESGVTAEELERQKTNAIGKFKVGLATTEGLAGALLRAIQGGFDAAWLADYPARIAALTVETVNGAIRRNLDPSRMTLVSAGISQPVVAPV